MNSHQPPAWLSEQPQILDILHYVINRLDKRSDHKQALSLIITEKKFPGLFTIAEEEAELIWALITKLADSYGLWTVRPGKITVSHLPYEKARLIFQLNKEECVRLWLDRPKRKSYAEQWQQAIEFETQRFPGSIEKLSAYPIKVKGVSIETILRGFLYLKDYKNSQLYLRQVSANCFWGDSKFLDGRDSLIESLYPGFLSGLLIRPVMAHVYVPANIQAVLFIENQDSYTYCLNKPDFLPPDYALVYVSGFKLTAQRIREQGGVNFQYGVGTFVHGSQEFENWWLGKIGTELNCYFWGDLDYSGMAILAGLKRLFPNLQCWQQAYGVMLDYLDQGHKPETTGKIQQLDPGITGCEYADRVLLPALRSKQRFVDQEIVY